jgi:hypothetical protein
VAGGRALTPVSALPLLAGVFFCEENPMKEINMGETLWAWVTELPDGSVSLISASFPTMGHMPLIGRSEKALTSPDIEKIAHDHGEFHKQRVWLRRYTLAEDIGK